MKSEDDNLRFFILLPEECTHEKLKKSEYVSNQMEINKNAENYILVFLGHHVIILLQNDRFYDKNLPLEQTSSFYLSKVMILKLDKIQ